MIGEFQQPHKKQELKSKQQLMPAIFSLILKHLLSAITFI
jgi:hypothetical protein